MSKTKDLLNELLVNLFNHITNIENIALKQMGVKLSINEVHILEAIKNTEIPTMTNVATRLLITVGTLTTSIDRLVTKGFVIRYQEESDRRKVLLRLTSRGEEIIKLHDVFHNEMIENAIKDFNINDDSQLLTTLENLANYFKDKYHERVSDLKNDR